MATGPGRYDEILACFTRHVAESGYDGVNFGAVAAEVGVSKGTIVHHFGTKERLFATLVETYMQRSVEVLDTLLGALHDPAEQLAAVLHACLLLHEAERDATVASQREIVRLTRSEAMEATVALRAAYVERVRAIVRRGVEQGQLRDVPATVDTLLIFGAAQWAWTWFDPDGPLDAAAVGSAFVDLVLGSLLVDRARLAALADPRGQVACVARRAMGLEALDAQPTKMQKG